MEPNEHSSENRIKILPYVMFGIFALYWSGVNLVNGQYLFIVPSLLIAISLIIQVTRK